MLIGHDYFKFKLVALKRAIGFVSYLYCTIIADQSPNLREGKRYWKKDYQHILKVWDSLIVIQKKMQYFKTPYTYHLYPKILLIFIKYF